MNWKCILFPIITMVTVLPYLITLSCSKPDKKDAVILHEPGLTKQSQPGASISDHKNPVEMIKNHDELLSIIEGSPGKLLVFDLYADWCRPCIMLAPTFSSLAGDHSKHARFFRIDIDRNPDIVSIFSVRSIPLVIFMKDKEIVHAVSGLKPRENYERVITTCGQSISAADCRTKLEEIL